MRARLEQHLVGYGLLSFGLSSVHNLMLVYHVDAYINAFKIGQAEFMTAEVIFMVWNCCNDLIWGWLSDMVCTLAALTHTHPLHLPRCSFAAVVAFSSARCRGLQLAGVGLASSFVLLWNPLLPVAWHFTLCLVLYDGFLTWVDLQISALLSDLVITSEDRATLSSAASVGSVIGTSSLFISMLLWDPVNIGAFRWFTACVATLSVAAFARGSALLRCVATAGRTCTPAGGPQNMFILLWAMHAAKPLSMARFAWQMATNANFMWFSLLHLIQVFHCHFNSNFFPLFLGVLLGDHLPKSLQGVLLCVSFVLPHLNNVMVNQFVKSHGLYNVVRLLLFIKLGLGLLAGVSGSILWGVIALLVASNRVVTEGTCKILSLVITDLVDEDMVRRYRPASIAALIFGTANFLSKPGQTLAPIVGTMMIDEQVEGGLFHQHQHQQQQQAAGDANQDQLRAVLLQMLWMVPVGCAAIQLLAWSRFTLHGPRLQAVRRIDVPVLPTFHAYVHQSAC
ncbi:uncharacterized protein MONBRDRAFT_13785 [Monosiga brevicollis MX1]|uniref:Transmembrane protein 180 n=1 Tax=Monosiga brevicollis TaxID=81824 RepID=A9UPD8_MONBE|nr:uncharacterized protein MONBRDRAFT_13785 [Monosiga brevicollis MX1]EDQ92401.1 predicted protein [Monosiga brevicollis MX1]|eukprot:XP_001742163.1 hypothetical protein [Monosiga brevicollis MX1]